MATMTFADAIHLHFGYNDWVLTCEHSTSSYGVPVLIAPDDSVYGRADRLPANGRLAITGEPARPWTGADAVAFCASYTHPMGERAHSYMRLFLGGTW